MSPRPTTLRISASFAFDVDQPTDVLLQYEAATLREQRVTSASTRLVPACDLTRVGAEESIGERIWLQARGHVAFHYFATVEIERPSQPLGSLSALAPHDLPGEAVTYLLDSSYCPAETLQAFVESEFADTEGGARIEAMREWVHANFTYTSGSSGPETGAIDSFVARSGVCRDFAHVMISLARACAIPARYVACFAPRVDPPDFHACVEVYLSDPAGDGKGSWYLVDATGMAEPHETAIIGVGRDAADVSFLTSFGPSNFRSLAISVVKE